PTSGVMDQVFNPESVEAAVVKLPIPLINFFVCSGFSGRISLQVSRSNLTYAAGLLGEYTSNPRKWGCRICRGLSTAKPTKPGYETSINRKDFDQFLRP